MTLDYANRNLAAYNADPSEQNRSASHFVSPSVFHSSLPDFNHIEALVNGPAHLVANLVKDLLSCVFNATEQFNWSAQVRQLEGEHGRFLQYVHF